MRERMRDKKRERERGSQGKERATGNERKDER